MVTTVISSTVVSDLVIGIASAGCIVFSIVMVLSDEEKWPTLALLNRSLTAFTIPLLILFTYITINWVANILTG